MAERCEWCEARPRVEGRVVSLVGRDTLRVCQRCFAEADFLNENERLRVALAKLRHCSHACGPAPCPHTRKYEEDTKGLI